MLTIFEQEKIYTTNLSNSVLKMMSMIRILKTAVLQLRPPLVQLVHDVVDLGGGETQSQSPNHPKL